MSNRMAGRFRALRWLAAPFLVLAVVTAAPQTPWPGLSAAAYAAPCEYDDNLNDTARTFIGRCCEGGINREFPGEYYDVTLSQIKADSKAGNASARKAYKLLNDSRFRK